MEAGGQEGGQGGRRAGAQVSAKRPADPPPRQAFRVFPSVAGRHAPGTGVTRGVCLALARDQVEERRRLVALAALQSTGGNGLPRAVPCAGEARVGPINLPVGDTSRFPGCCAGVSHCSRGAVSASKKGPCQGQKRLGLPLPAATRLRFHKRGEVRLAHSGHKQQAPADPAQCRGPTQSVTHRVCFSVETSGRVRGQL